MKLGENILKLRKENKLSQEELAENVNVTRQTISNWELGETQPTPEQLKKLSSIFHVSIDELLDNNVDKILIEKVSNTEKLAGMIIKILKVIGILFLILLIIDIICFIVFCTIKKDQVTSLSQEASVSCSLDSFTYDITLGSDSYFECSNCNENIRKDIYSLIDYSNIDGTISKIEKYFDQHQGSCE